MTKPEVDFQTKIISENYEELEVSCSSTGIGITIARFENTPARHTNLSFLEFDELVDIVARYKKMREIAGC